MEHAVIPAEMMAQLVTVVGDKSGTLVLHIKDGKALSGEFETKVKLQSKP
jgi:hypothetical protein